MHGRACSMASGRRGARRVREGQSVLRALRTMLHFDKYHGIGNDFLVVDAESPGSISVERVMALCDRHYGVGGDGVLVVSPASDGAHRARMDVINADGSRPEMCGNGLRCVALHLARKDESKITDFIVETGAGPLRCDVSRDGDLATVGTEIGKGISVGTLDFNESGTTYSFHRIETGNPHAIWFGPQIDVADLDRLGPAVSGSIAGGANVEIATLKSPTEIDVTVWERGVGRTLACGTGAAATVICATMKGLSPLGSAVKVHLPGGTLEITVDEDHTAYLKGPAQWVFRGEIPT